MTILIHFHQLRFRDFTTYDVCSVLGHVQRAFPQAVSYQRVVELMPTVLGPRCAYLPTWYRQGCGMSFVDSTALAVGHHRRIRFHRVVRGLAQRGRTALGWFYGFKVHIVLNHHGALLACQLTSGNTADRRPGPKLAARLWGRLCGDTGYLSASLSHMVLHTRRLRLVTHGKRNMVNRLIVLHDTRLRRHRALMETVFDHLK